MSVIDSRKFKKIKQRKYLNKDFEGFKSDLLEYARLYFGDRIKDFSEASLGGLLLELAAYIGDVQSFYLDHQFHELSPETAVELRNIERLLREAGVEITGASPAVCEVTFIIEVPVQAGSNPPRPDTTALPIIYSGTIVVSNSGINFELTEDVDFTETDKAGNLTANIQIAKRDTNNNVTSFYLSKSGLCVSGMRATEIFNVEQFVPFYKYTLANENVTDIISVTDNFGNTYYKVGFLTQDTVYKAIINKNDDNELVKENLVPIPAPFRFITRTSLETRLTTLIFGGGSATSLEDDVVPDPSEFALPLYGKKVISRFTLDPGNLLKTRTLGVIMPNSTITVVYRYGGGLSHNVAPETIRTVQNLIIGFPNNPTPAVASFVRGSLDVINFSAASGGEDPPTIDELRLNIASAKFAQSRIVTKEDLISRIYLMPSNFGRVFRASIRSNPNNPLSSILYIISRDKNGNLVVSPDSLKKNLVTFLNQYRMISDAIDILDAQIINLQLFFTVVVEPGLNKNLVLQNIIDSLKQYFDIKHFEIDQPIVLDDIRNIIYNNEGVVSIQSLSVVNVTGKVGDRVYSDVQFDVESNTVKGLIIGPPGSIFEIKYKDNDIIGSVI